MTGVLWSTLRKFGQSRFLKLTIFAPFLGSIVLFDDNFSNFLVNGRSVFLSFPHVDTQLAQQLSGLNAYKLYYFYLGLSFLGFGSFVFLTLCPKEIKLAETEAEFIAIETPMFSSLRGWQSLFSISEKYLDNGNIGSKGLRRRFQNVSYNIDDAERYERLIHEMYHTGNNVDLGGPAGGFISASDFPIYDKVATMITSRIRAQRALWTSFEAASKDFSSDLLRYEFELADKSKPVARALVVAFYVIGLTFLIIPTGRTFLQICALWLHSFFV